MSSRSSKNVACPKCEKEQSVTVWDSVNATRDPGLREGILHGGINEFKCSDCGHEAFLLVPLLYHDMRRDFCVQYYPPQCLDDPEFFNQFESSYPATRIGFPEFVKKHMPPYLMQPHIVFDMNDMRHCIVFYEKLLGHTVLDGN